MDDRQAAAIIERRRQELLHRRERAMAEAARAALVLSNAAQALRHAEEALARDGWPDEPPLTPDDAGRALAETAGMYSIDLHGLMNAEAKRLLDAAMNEINNSAPEEEPVGERT